MLDGEDVVGGGRALDAVSFECAAPRPVPDHRYPALLACSLLFAQLPDCNC
jgi:hypothetical protein